MKQLQLQDIIFHILGIDSFLKINSNPYHYILKFILTSKQKYNSKFQEFETVRNLKIQKTTKFGPKKFLRINDYEKLTKKGERKKKKAIFKNPFFSFEILTGFEFLRF